MPRPIGEQITAALPPVIDTTLSRQHREPKSAATTSPVPSDSEAVTVEISTEAREAVTTTENDGPKGRRVSQAVAEARAAARANGEKIGPAVSQAARQANGSLPPPPPPAPDPVTEPDPTTEPAPTSDPASQPSVPTVPAPSAELANNVTGTTPQLSTDSEPLTPTTTLSVFAPLSLLA